MAKYELKSNQYIPHKPKSLPSGMPKCETYYYIVNEDNKVVDKDTLKPYRGKQMNRYAIFGSRAGAELYFELITNQTAKSIYENI